MDLQIESENRMKKPELLIPASSLEVLKIAVMFGADAVYIGGEAFGLRAKAKNFTKEEMAEGIAFAHAHNVKVFVTANILAHNYDLDGAREYFKELKEMKPDALIVADPGMVMLAKEECPEIDIHISTQANNTNYQTFLFWYHQGIRRVVTASELSLVEIKQIREKIPEDMEIESFVHGAMCISYSGRCLMSNFMTGRDANMGACTHPCRWKYSIVEEKRPGEYYPIEEDSHGSYIMNSRDLCMLDGIPDLAAAGVSSLKIEGRMKSAYYVATVVSAYRTALDHYLADPDNYQYDPAWFTELCKASHREFTHGFYYNKPSAEDQNYQSSDYIREYSFVGMVKGVEPETGFALVEQRNKFSIGDEIEIFGPGVPFTKEVITEMYNQEGEPVESAPHPQQIIKLKLSTPVKENYILRMKKQL